MLFVGFVDDVARFGQKECREASKLERQNLHRTGIAAFEKTSDSKYHPLAAYCLPVVERYHAPLLPIDQVYVQQDRNVDKDLW